MDAELKKILKLTSQIIAKLKDQERESLYLDAHKKVLLAELTNKAAGKSHAEREIKALVDPSYDEFLKGLSIAESETNALKRRLELLNNAFMAEYLEIKINNEGIKRGVE